MMIQKDNKLRQVPQPVVYDYIQFNDGDRHVKYTDCWEISVLRFLHLIFGQGGVINMCKLKKFMNQTDQNCLKLIKYFELNSTYSIKQQFYRTQEGFKIRSEWAQFCNNCGLLNVKIDKKYEVAATVPNMLAFFKGFFPKLNILQAMEFNYDNIISKELFKNYQLVLGSIYSQFSFQSKLQVKIKQLVIDQQNYLYFDTIQHIYIDGKHQLDWEIYQNYTIYDDQIDKRLGGHSDYRFPHQKLPDLS